jgi:tetratricopeptide (TPR) repeat protein
MVLPASAADDESGPREADWVGQISLGLRLSRASILILVDGAGPGGLADVVRGLVREHPRLEVHDDVRAVATADPGSVLVLVPKPEDADWLNLERPLFAQRALKVVLFCDHATTVELAQRAPDFFDWVSQRHDCPPGPPGHAVRGLRMANALAASVAWVGAGEPSDLEVLREALSAAFPSRDVRWLAASDDYEALVAGVRTSRAGWLACQALTAPALRRLRWALAEAEKLRDAIVITSAPVCPGFWPVHGRSMPFAEARRVLAGAGAARAGCLAALTGLEPEAVELARVLLAGGAHEGPMLELLRDADDPGAALARESASGRAPPEVALWQASPPVLRAFAAEPRVRDARRARLEGAVEALAEGGEVPAVDFGALAAAGAVPASCVPALRKGPPKDDETVAFVVEALLPHAQTQGLWVDLAEQAVLLGERGAAGAWALRAAEQGLGPARALRALAKQLDRGGLVHGERLREVLGPRARLARATTTALERAALIVSAFLFLGGLLALVGAVAGALFFVAPDSVPWVIALVVASMALFAVLADALRPRFSGLVTKVSFELQWRAWLRRLVRRTGELEAPVEAARRQMDRGAYGQAIRALEALLATARRAPGDDLALAFDALAYRAVRHALARAFAEQGEDDKALAALAEALSLEACTLGLQTEDVAALVPTLAEVLARVGRMRDAEALLRTVLGPDASLPGEPEGEAVPAAPPLAKPRPTADLDELVPLLLAQRSMPPLSADQQVRALRLLAEVLLAQGRYAEAEALLGRAFERQEALPTDHRERWRTLVALGRVLAVQGRLSGAHETLERAAAEAEATGCAGHVDRGRALHDLARIELHQGDPRAADTARRALAIYVEAGVAEDEKEVARRELKRIEQGNKRDGPAVADAE